VVHVILKRHTNPKIPVLKHFDALVEISNAVKALPVEEHSIDRDIIIEY